MANKLISEMGLPKSITNVFTARNIITAKDALSLSEFELMELLDVGLEEVMLAVAHISEISCPPYQTAMSLLEQRNRNEYLAGHLPTRLKGLDAALCGGIPFGVVTELVGPAGIGKTQMAGRILVLQPASLSEFTESLQKIKLSLLQQNVKLLIIDSMTALASGEYGEGNTPRLGWHISFIKSLAEFCRIPVVVTNQVRSQGRDEASRYLFQGHSKADTSEDSSKIDSHLVAALGIHWAHAVSIRLVLESRSGQRLIKIAKSSISPCVGFFFCITSSGISLLEDEGVEMMGPEANTIHCQGHSGIINYDGEALHSATW
ncbi:hypothetical protein ACS0TY_014704 [Phlomoides rotata]